MDKVEKEWFDSLKRSTANCYDNGLMHFCEFTKMTPEQLLAEAKEDYINRVPPWELRYIKKIENFQDWLRKSEDIKHKRRYGNGEKLISNNSKSTWIKSVKSFYSFYKIPASIVRRSGIPSVVREEYAELPPLKLEDVRKALVACGVDKMKKALILTILQSVQGQSEVRNLKGKHLKNIKLGVAIINTHREKDFNKRRYICFIGHEALAAIREYKENIPDNEFVFTQPTTGKPLTKSSVSDIFGLITEKCGFQPGYFNAHRVRHYWKTMLTGKEDKDIVEYIMGHKLKGTDGNYFLGREDELLEVYLKHLNILTVHTPQEQLQKELDDLKKRSESSKLENIEALEKQVQFLSKRLGEISSEHLKLEEGSRETQKALDKSVEDNQELEKDIILRDYEIESLKTPPQEMKEIKKRIEENEELVKEQSA